MIWAIAYVIMVAVAMWGYIKVSDIKFEAQVQATNIFSPTHSYNDHRLGFGIRYPASWSIEVESSSTVLFVPTDTADVGVSIMQVDVSAEKLLRESLDIVAESVVFVDGIKATMLVNDLGNRVRETVVLVIRKDKLFVISGSQHSVEQTLLTFRFLN